MHSILDSSRPFPVRSVHDAFAARAASAPGAPCVMHEGRTFTYRTVEEHSDAVADRLAAHGVTADTVVAVILPRGAGLIAAVLGTLKSGAAYLTVDVATPAARLVAMLDAAGVRLVLTDTTHAALLVAPDRVVLDIAAATAGAYHRHVPVPPHPDDLAYVVFTSGSMGRPKPVAVPHRALANHLAATADRYALTATDRVLQFANPAFDVFAEEVFPTLAAGATLVVPDSMMEPAALAGLLDRYRVTVANLPTSYWNQWTHDLDTGAAGVPDSLRLLVVGSEAAYRDTLVRWRSHTPVPVVNAYGLSETTVTVTAGTVDSNTDDSPVLPIGSPLDGCTALVLDAALTEVPAGTPGELYLGGACLARGYVGLPDRTADRFVPHPRPERPGDRLYRTGDLVRRRSDGRLEFLGRLDRQLKVRGHRIEPVEVEAALVEHPLVTAAHVSVIPDARLVAHLVPADDRRVPGAADLRAHLTARLPAWMVPQSYVVLDGLPLTPTGKVDEAALPPVRTTVSTVAYAEPRGALEHRLAGIWRSVLGTARVGRDDDLFDLGGHSLTLARVAARIRAELGVDVGLPELFGHPTVAALAGRIDAGRPERPALPPIGTPPDTGRTPLSYQQLQMWFLTALAPDSIAYHAQTTIRVVGPLDLDVLDRVVTEIARRHEIMRTTYHQGDAEPYQVVHPPQPVTVRRADLTGVPAADRERRCEELVQEELHAPFDLGRLPLLRWTAVRLAPREYELVLVEHHMVHDGWSFALLMREVRELYGAFLRGEASPLPELTMQYRHFASWQRSATDSPAMRAQLAYWRTRLASMPGTLSLPRDRPRPAVQTYRGRTLRVELPTGLPAALRAYSRSRRVTLYTTMYAAFALLLRRCTGQTDVCLGSAFANRQSPQVQDLIGMFVNPVVLRLEVDDRESFDVLAGRAAAAVLDASENQELPFPVLVRELNPGRDVAGNPLVQTLFSANDSPLPELRLGDATGTVFERGNGSAKVDLDVVVVPRAESQVGSDTGHTDDRILLLWEYNADLFDESTMRGLVAAYLHLLADAAVRPDVPVRELELLDEAAARVVAAHDGPAAVGVELPVHRLVAGHARRRPDAPAVVTATERLTYGELHARADALATRLRDAGAGPGRVVAVCLPRGAGLVVAQLGILRAGAAFLPIDPENPAERIAQLCADAQAVSMVGDEQSAPALPSGVRLIGVYGPAADATGADEGPVPATRPAYVIFTSGSTGRPKGVLVEHGALANLAAWHRDMFGLTPRDRVTMVASPGFDASVGEIWPTLAAGAALYVPDAETRLSAPRLAAWLAGNEITVSDLPTALAEAVLEEPWPPDIALRHLITGGDRLRVRPPADLPFRFVNTYGPTESTVMVTAGPVRPEHDRHGTPGIGRPVPGATVRVLDDELRAVPDGVPGQIFLAGNTLARGYLGPAGLTADRFVPDPFRPGGRLYRTGDLARRRPDGALEFLGRVDDQLSVRGFRIEPAEIVAALRTHPAVADAYVTTRSPDGTGDPLLVAYLAGYAAGGDRPGPAALRRHLAATLPAYLVPHRFAWLPALPLNRNGKIDERALPDPPHLAPVPAAAAPATEVERLVAGLWRDTLGLAEVGVHDNFFDLGGHSLQLGRVHHRLTEELRRDVPLLDLFRYPTVRSLAEHLTGGPAEAGADDPAGGSREAARARLSRRRGSITGTAR